MYNNIPVNKEIITFLSSLNANCGFIDRMKINFRPLICPMRDLLKWADGANSVLDLGSGSGQFCALLSRYSNVKKIHGLEINQELIDNSIQLLSGIKNEKKTLFSLYDGHNLPDYISEYDVVYMIDIFHHIPKAKQIGFIYTLFQKMKLGGRLVFKDIDRGSIWVYFNKLHDLVLSKEIGNEISYNNAILLVKEAGFTITQSFKRQIYCYPHFFLICKK